MLSHAKILLDNVETCLLARESELSFPLLWEQGIALDIENRELLCRRSGTLLAKVRMESERLMLPTYVADDMDLIPECCRATLGRGSKGVLTLHSKKSARNWNVAQGSIDWINRPLDEANSEPATLYARPKSPTFEI